MARGARPVLTGADRVLAALKLLAERREAVALDEFAQELNAPKSTTHRVLATLRRAGLADQDEHSRYRLSLEFLRLAFRYHESLDYWELIQGVLQELTAQFGETAYFAKLDGGEIVYIAMTTAPGHLHTASVLGARAAAYRTGLGKALLAATLSDSNALLRFIEEHGPLRAATTHSLVTVSLLETELAATRARGWAIDNEENEDGVVCVAFPVYLDSASRPTGAISVAAIKMRTPLEQLVDRAEEIRSIIEKHLGTGVVSSRMTYSRVVPRSSNAELDRAQDSPAGALPKAVANGRASPAEGAPRRSTGGRGR